MKKIVNLFLLCGLLVCFAAGCADVAEEGADSEIASEYSEQLLDAAAVTEEGYYILEGSLHEIGKHAIVLESEDGQFCYFQMAPETIVYAGESTGLIEGQAVKVVFDGKLNGTKLEDISVIAITVLEEEL